MSGFKSIEKHGYNNFREEDTGRPSNDYSNQTVSNVQNICGSKPFNLGFLNKKARDRYEVCSNKVFIDNVQNAGNSANVPKHATNGSAAQGGLAGTTINRGDSDLAENKASIAYKSGLSTMAIAGISAVVLLGVGITVFYAIKK